jgi:uncharacterized protein YacL
MSKQNDEVERLRRLRERQLQARDPLSKQRKIDRKVTARRRKQKKSFSFRAMLDMPYQWRGAIIGAVIGMGISIVLTLTLENQWTEVIGLLVVVFLAVLGVVFGQAMDAREELKDLMD